ncbi:Vegetative incompatibility protein HET-E-1 like [Verticillium longisporum]|uniref:Vegetative incompatibility protein HET-E-1 like n=1 Tax=Verticillium longisporum TaxID=100787 RepID=A0A8I3AYH2_VERLO|nr:Vegetative incompatibility protein HET-E-1 like [Verticillium longisporum]
MFRWYEQAAVCYVYLADVRAGGRPSAAPLAEIGASEWFRRGWTLQELLAPKTVEFYDADWQFVGTRTSLQRTISEASSIPGRFLSGESHIRSARVAQRMAWAATRQTTRLEDQVYSLMGLFDVNMPLLKMKTTIVESKDWTIPELEKVTVTSGSYSGLLATTPARFTVLVHWS